MCISFCEAVPFLPYFMPEPTAKRRHRRGDQTSGNTKEPGFCTVGNEGCPAFSTAFRFLRQEGWDKSPRKQTKIFTRFDILQVCPEPIIKKQPLFGGITTEKEAAIIANVIYLDVLIAVNLFVTYFLLLSTALLLHQKPKRWRMVFGALLGGASSLMIFLEQLPWFIPVLAKVVLGIILVLIAFPWRGKGVFIKTASLFIAVNFLFAGVMMALWFFVAPVDMYYRNGVVYFNISALTLAISTVAAYLVVRFIGWILDRRVPKNTIKPIIISLNGKEVFLNAFDDSGNRLTDPFTGTPVIICEYEAIKPLLPEFLQPYFSNSGELPPLSENWAKRIRVVPYHVVGSDGVMRCFSPDRFQTVGNKAAQEYRVFIGVSNSALSSGEYTALYNANLTNQT